MGTNVMSGVGCARDLALRKDRRTNTKTFNIGVARERCTIPMDATVEHADLVQGDLCAVRAGSVVPLNHSPEFVGIVDAIGEDRSRYLVSVVSRGAIVVRVEGLTKDSCRSKVYALPADRSETFTLHDTGILIGEVLAIESLDRSMAIVGFRLQDDSRPFHLAGARAAKDPLA